MVKHGLYVFGGHHTMTTLVRLQQDELDFPYDTAAAKPASWYRWPALVIALPGALSQYVKYLDICSEFDNEPIALVPSFKDKVLKLRMRWEQRFGTYRGYEDAKRDGEVKEWIDSMALALNLSGSAGIEFKFKFKIEFFFRPCWTNGPAGRPAKGTLGEVSQTSDRGLPRPQAKQRRQDAPGERCPYQNHLLSLQSLWF